MNSVENNVEIKGVISLIYLVDKVVKAHYCPLIKLFHAFIGNAVLIQIESALI